MRAVLGFDKARLRFGVALKVASLANSTVLCSVSFLQGGALRCPCILKFARAFLFGRQGTSTLNRNDVISKMKTSSSSEELQQDRCRGQTESIDGNCRPSVSRGHRHSCEERIS